MESKLDFNDEDLREALKDIGSYVDITEEDLKKIYLLALKHARQRIAISVSVNAVMTKEVISIDKDDDIRNAVRLLSENNVSGLPVTDREGRVVGVVSEADVLGTVGMKRDHTFRDVIRSLLGEPMPSQRAGEKVGDVMSVPPIIIRPDAELGEAAWILTEKRIKRLPVVDDENRLIGIISRADIVRAAQGDRK
jgi:CBS domain-containing membrane protein